MTFIVSLGIHQIITWQVMKVCISNIDHWSAVLSDEMYYQLKHNEYLNAVHQAHFKYPVSKIICNYFCVRIFNVFNVLRQVYNIFDRYTTM